jgi:hypothetical protein
MKLLKDGYISMPRDKELHRVISHLIATTLSNESLDNPEGRLLAVVGLPGAGKSRAIARRLAKEPSISGCYISVKAPHPFTSKQLARAILHALDYPLQRDLKENMAWDLARRQLALTGTRLIWIDELHHALLGRSEVEVMKISESLKGLMINPNSPISLIVSGLPTVSAFIGSDAQIYHRSETVEFGSIALPDNAYDIKTTMCALISRAGMKQLTFADDDFIEKLCIAADLQFGMVIDFVREALFKAFQRLDFNGTITVADFAAVYSMKRHCVPAENIFTAHDWQNIVPRNSRLRDVPAAPQSETAVHVKRRNKRS